MICSNRNLFPPVYPRYCNIPTRFLGIPLGTSYLGQDLALMWFWGVNNFEPTIQIRFINALLGYRVLLSFGVHCILCLVLLEDRIYVILLLNEYETVFLGI